MTICPQITDHVWLVCLISFFEPSQTIVEMLMKSIMQELADLNGPFAR